MIRTLFIAGMILFSLPIYAYPAPLKMEYNLGFDGRFKMGTWTPLTIQLENRGQTTKGTLEVVVTTGSEYRRDVYRTTYSRDVELPYRSKKLCSFTVLIRTVIHDMVIRFRKGPRIILTESIILRPYSTEKSLAVIADSMITPDFLSVFPEELLPVRVSGRDLPEDWYGYEGAGILILNPKEVQGLREPQYRSLKQWIERGGFLIFSGEINYGPLLEKRLQRLMPMKILGQGLTLGLKSLESFSGQELAGPAPFFILKAEIEDSDIIVQERDIPVISRKKIGAGSIIFLSFDIRTAPFSRWDNRKEFWRKILSLRPRSSERGIDLTEQKIMDSLLSSAKIAYPGFTLSLVFMAVYLLLTGFLYQRLGKHRKKRLRNTLCLLSVIAFFSLLSYVIFFHLEAKRPLSYNSFLQLNIDGGTSDATGKYLLGLYSMRGATYDLGFGGSWPVTHQLSGTSGALVPNYYELVETESGPHIKGKIKKWSHNFFSIETRMEFPVRGTATWNERDLNLIIENRSRFEIVDCLIYFDERFIELNDIRRNEHRVLNIPRKDIDRRNRFDGIHEDLYAGRERRDGSPGFLRGLQNSLGKDISSNIRAGSKEDLKNIQMIGWIRSGIIDPEFKEKGITGEGVTLIHVEIPLRSVS